MWHLCIHTYIRLHHNWAKLHTYVMSLVTHIHKVPFSPQSEEKPSKCDICSNTHTWLHSYTRVKRNHWNVTSVVTLIYEASSFKETGHWNVTFLITMEWIQTNIKSVDTHIHVAPFLHHNWGLLHTYGMIGDTHTFLHQNEEKPLQWNICGDTHI